MSRPAGHALAKFSRESVSLYSARHGKWLQLAVPHTTIAWRPQPAPRGSAPAGLPGQRIPARSAQGPPAGPGRTHRPRQDSLVRCGPFQRDVPQRSSKLPACAGDCGCCRLWPTVCAGEGRARAAAARPCGVQPAAEAGGGEPRAAGAAAQQGSGNTADAAGGRHLDGAAGPCIYVSHNLTSAQAAEAKGFRQIQAQAFQRGLPAGGAVVLPRSSSRTGSASSAGEGSSNASGSSGASSTNNTSDTSRAAGCTAAAAGDAWRHRGDMHGNCQLLLLPQLSWLLDDNYDVAAKELWLRPYKNKHTDTLNFYLLHTQVMGRVAQGSWPSPRPDGQLSGAAARANTSHGPHLRLARGGGEADRAATRRLSSTWRSRRRRSAAGWPSCSSSERGAFSRPSVVSQPLSVQLLPDRLTLPHGSRVTPSESPTGARQTSAACCTDRQTDRQTDPIPDPICSGAARVIA